MESWSGPAVVTIGWEDITIVGEGVAVMGVDGRDWVGEMSTVWDDVAYIWGMEDWNVVYWDDEDNRDDGIGVGNMREVRVWVASNGEESGVTPADDNGNGDEDDGNDDDVAADDIDDDGGDGRTDIDGMTADVVGMDTNGVLVKGEWDDGEGVK